MQDQISPTSSLPEQSCEVKKMLLFAMIYFPNEEKVSAWIPGGTHKHFFDSDARPGTSFNNLKKINDSKF